MSRTLPPDFGPPVVAPVDEPDDWASDELTRPGAVEPGLLLLSALAGAAAALAVAAVAGAAAWLL